MPGVLSLFAWFFLPMAADLSVLVQFGGGDAKEKGSGVLKLGCKERTHWRYPARYVEHFLSWHANALTIRSRAISDMEG